MAVTKEGMLHRINAFYSNVTPIITFEHLAGFEVRIYKRLFKIAGRRISNINMCIAIIVTYDEPEVVFSVRPVERMGYKFVNNFFNDTQLRSIYDDITPFEIYIP